MVKVPTGCSPPMGRKMNPDTHRCYDRKSELYGYQCLIIKMSNLYPRENNRRGNHALSREKYRENTRKVSKNYF